MGNLGYLTKDMKGLYLYLTHIFFFSGGIFVVSCRINVSLDAFESRLEWLPVKYISRVAVSW